MSAKGTQQEAQKAHCSPGPMPPVEIESQAPIAGEVGVRNADFIGRTSGLSLYAARDLESVADVWREFQGAAWFTPFQDIAWVEAWYAAGGRANGHKPFVVLGYEGCHLRFILPLAVQRSVGVARLIWLGQGVNDYNAPLIDAAFAARCERALADKIWHRVLNACDAIDLIEFTKQPERVAGEPNRFINAAAVTGSCSAHLINLQPGWKDFYASLRGSKSRRRLREKANKLGRVGRLRFKCEKRPVERCRLIRQAIAWKSEQLQRSGDRNPFDAFASDDVDGTILERTLVALAEMPDGQRRLRVDGLYVGDDVAAIIIALVGPDCYSVFITSHPANGKMKYSPGTILLVKTMQLAVRAGLSQYDFLAGDEAYKMDWCNEQVVLYDHAHGLTVKGRWAASVSRSLLWAKKAIKGQPKTMELLKNINRQRLKLR